MLRKPYKRRERTILIKRDCFFCKKKQEPDYKMADILSKFLRDTGRITSRKYTGTCSKHQRKLAKAIKRARILALLPFTQKV